LVCGKQGEEQMTTHITKTWFDGEKVVTQEIPESEIYKQEQEQEPVAWMYVNTDGECEQIEYGLCDFDDPSIQLLYTVPRQWVGLTDDDRAALREMATFMDETDCSHLLSLAEERLKEKNR
jgi:hypothetical protein